MISRDLVETLERKIGFSLNGETKAQIKYLEEQFLKVFWGFVPSNIADNGNGEKRILVKRMVGEVEPVVRRLEFINSVKNYPTISLDRIYVPKADYFLDITRLTNPKTGEVRLSERPGTMKLEEQLRELPNYNCVNLSDVGAFSGESLLEIVERIKSRGINVRSITLGFADLSAMNKLAGIVDSVSMPVLYPIPRFYEWIELRDLFGIDGRAVGFNGRRKFIPYWENLTQWASVPPENEVMAVGLCKEYNKRLIAVLKKEGQDVSKIGIQVPYEVKK